MLVQVSGERPAGNGDRRGFCRACAMEGQQGLVRGCPVAGQEGAMNVLDESRYRVFATATFPGNPVTLHEVDALDNAGSLRHRARRSWSEDNGFFVAREGRP